MDINQQIRSYIESRGLTFTYIANKTGINIKKLSRMMTNKQRIYATDYAAICRALDVDPGYFFENDFLEAKKTTA